MPSSSRGALVRPSFWMDFSISTFTDITALQRSQLLEKSDLFSSIHAGAAQGGQTAAPSANVEPPFAYTCFVQARAPPSFRNGEHRLLELNGARDGPIDRGTCNNLLEDVAEYVRETHVNHNLNPKISMLALGPSI